VMNVVSGRITARRGPRPPMVAGLALAGVGLLLLARVGPRARLAAIVAPLLAVGLGSALTMPAMTAAVIEHTPRERAGIGSAVLNASRQVGGVVGIALLGALIGTHGARGPAAVEHFVSGFHKGLALAGLAFLAGSVLSFVAIDRDRGDGEVGSATRIVASRV